MWTTFETWQLAQLQRLSQTDTEQVETVMNTVWNSYPGLLSQLAISAVDQEQLSVDACATLLNVDIEEIEAALLEFRQKNARCDYQWAVVVDRDSSIAKLADSRVAVWEIVREYRKLGSVERLVEAFPTLPKSELAAALTYAEQNPGEIEAQIDKYETILQKKRAEYPFMK